MMDEWQLKGILDEAVSRGATADQVRELHARITQQQNVPRQEFVQQTSNHDEMYNKALSAEASSPLAALTGYGANAIHQVPFLSEAGSAIAAGLGAGQGDTFKNRYDNLQQSQQVMREAANTLQPGPNTLGKVSAFIPQLAVNVGPSMVKNAAIGAAYGGSDTNSFETDENAISDRLKGAAKGGAFAGGVTAAIQGVPTIARGVMASSPEAIDSAKRALFNIGSETSAQMQKIGAAPTRDASMSLATKTIDAINANGSKLDTVLTPQTTQLVKLMSQDAINGKLDIAAIDKYASLLNDVGGSAFDMKAATQAKRALISALNELKPTDLSNYGREAVSLLNQKKAEFAKAFRFEEVGDLLEKAAGDREKIKTVMTKFLRDNDYAAGLAKKGWKPNEIEAAENAAKTGAGEWLNKAIGVFGVDLTKPSVGNFLIPALEGGAAALLPGASGVALPLAAAGTAARLVNTMLARGKAQKLLNTIKNNPVTIPGG